MGEALLFGLVILDTVIPGLVNDLGHPQFLRRESAQAVLRDLAPMAAPRLEQAKRHADPEVAYRADRLMAEYHLLRAEFLAPRLMPRDYPCLPWIDMLPSDFPGRDLAVRNYLEQVRLEGANGAGSGWPGYRRATFHFIRDQLSQGTHPDDVVALLDRMAGEEKSWVERNRPSASVIPMPRQAP